MPDPKIDAAMTELAAILKKHDLAGMVFVTSPTHTQFLYELCPSWSCTSIEQNVFRIRCVAADYDSPEAQKRALATTCGMFLGFRDVLQKAGTDLTGLINLVAKKVVIEHRSLLEPLALYTVSPDNRSITCHRCRMTSHHPKDVEFRYCGRCHAFLDDIPPNSRLMWLAAPPEAG